MKRLRCLPFIAACLALDPVSVRAADSEETQVLFSRHVIPVFSRLGCNAGGACHGTNKGQNGFRLSLFGAQPSVDHLRLTRELFSRRLNGADPGRSLILLKATGQVTHGGGKRTDVGSSDYQVLRSWIAGGCRLDVLSKSAVTKLVASPAEQVLKVGETGQLKVTATYSDGTTADVTRLCRYESHVEEIATVDPSGAAQARSVGDTVVIIRYGAEPVLASVLVVPAGKKTTTDAKPVNFIDQHILAKLRALDLVPAPLCDDETFLRRIYLDVTGLLPPADEVRKFLADNSPNRRTKKIDEVLARPGYGEIWASKVSDIIKPVERGNDGSNNLVGGQALRIRFYEWLRARLQENVPYDRLVEKIIVSSSREGRTAEQWAADVAALQSELATRKKGAVGEPLLSVYNQRQTLDLYWERDGATGVTGAMQFAHAFLGLRLQCAQCHRHPYDVWQQDDLLSFAHFFTAVNTAGGKRHSPEVEAFLTKLKTETMPLREEVKKLAASKDPTAKAKVAMLQAKIASADGLLNNSFEVTPLTTGIVATVSVTSPLGSQQSSKARLLGDKDVTVLPPDLDRRKLLMDWLRRPDNPFFAKAIVNRVWAHYFNRGLVDPADNLSPLNPPSHAKLLDELSQNFVKNGYDLRWLHRTILQSRTYQQSSLGKATAQDQRYYARFPMRRLQGEVILDVLNQATGAKEKYPANWMFREGERAVFAAGVMVDVYNFYTVNDPLRYLVFGRQVRRVSVQCDCEQGREVALPQMLYLANHEEVQKKISADNGRAALLAKNDKLDNRQRIEELFLSALARMPGSGEMNAALEFVNTSESRRKGLEEVFWSLVNTREFQLNY